jgi:hypothetical protein
VGLTDGFADLPRASRALHLGSLVSVALAGIMLIAPAAFHRIAEDGQRTPRFYRYASGMVQAALLPLAVGMGADFYVVVAKISASVVDGVVASTAVLLTMVGLWWGVPWLARRATRVPRDDAFVSTSTDVSPSCGASTTVTTSMMSGKSLGAASYVRNHTDQFRKRAG